MLQYNIELHQDGQSIRRFRVAAREVGLVGDYHEGVPYQPDTAAMLAALPATHRKAFKRALGWWQEHFPREGSRLMPLRLELTTLTGKSLGVLYATPDWPVL